MRNLRPQYALRLEVEVEGVDGSKPTVSGFQRAAITASRGSSSSSSSSSSSTAAVQTSLSSLPPSLTLLNTVSTRKATRPKEVENSVCQATSCDLDL